MALNLISLTHLGNSWNCSNIHIIRKKKSHSMRVGFLFAVSFFLFLKSLYLFVVQIDMVFKGCLRYCKSTSFQANHNARNVGKASCTVVCDTAKVRVFKQITTETIEGIVTLGCLRYCKSTSFQANHNKKWITLL